MRNLNMAAKAGYKLGTQPEIQKVGYKSCDKSEMCVEAWVISWKQQANNFVSTKLWLQ